VEDKGDYAARLKNAVNLFFYLITYYFISGRFEFKTTSSWSAVRI